MAPHHPGVRAAHQPFERFFKFQCRVLKTREELRRLRNVPARIHFDQQAVPVGGKRLLELAFEIVNALVEFIDLLYWTWPAQVGTGIRLLIRWPPKSGHDRNLRRAHLEEKQQQSENKQQQQTDRDRDGIAFHGDFGLRAGIRRFVMSPRIFSSRLSTTISSVFVAVVIILRASALYRLRACRYARFL